VRVIRVDFDSKDGISARIREKITTELRSQNFQRNTDPSSLKDLADEIAEVPMMEVLQERGYFKSTTAAKLTVLQSDGAEIDVAVAVRATPGLQYRTGDIQFESADRNVPLAISPEVLRGLVPLGRGGVFSARMVRTGMQNMRQAYVRVGYSDMTVGPEFHIGETPETMDMVLKIDQQAQFRIRAVEFLGMDSAIRQKLLESLPKPGEIFDETRLQEFFKVNASILPSDASTDDLNITKDVKARTVAILFDFRTCPPNTN
jgi:outer membrane protein assembly factor BamA